MEVKFFEKLEKFFKLKMVFFVFSIEVNSFLIILDLGIFFDVDKYDVCLEVEEVFKNFVIVLKEVDIKVFEIDGYIDFDVSDEYN